MFKTRKSKIVSLILGGVLLTGSVAGIAFADSTTPTTTTQDKTAYYQEFLSDFASNLGVSQDKVTTALQATKQQLVQEAVQQGKLTQDQANKILANNKNIGFGLGFIGRANHKKGDITQNPTYLSNAATALGLTVDQLKSDLQSGQTLKQIITAQGMTMDQFRQKMPQHHKKDSTSNTSTTTSTSN